MQKIKELITKFCTKEIILYVVFGVLTTLVNIATFYILNSICGVDENISNIIAILLSILFAYFTNKKAVFHSEANTFKSRLKEFSKFMLGRAFTMIFEFVYCFLLFKTTLSNLIVKVSVTVIVVIMNFFISKYFAFKKNK